MLPAPQDDHPRAGGRQAGLVNGPMYMADDNQVGKTALARRVSSEYGQMPLLVFVQAVLVFAFQKFVESRGQRGW